MLAATPAALFPLLVFAPEIGVPAWVIYVIIGIGATGTAAGVWWITDGNGEGALDSDVEQALDEIDRGAVRPNVRNPKPFDNDGRGESATLPKTDENGDAISYTEHTVNPRPPGGALDGKRIVTGSDGSVHVTTDHFGSFTRVR